MEILKTVLLFIQDQILGMEWLGEMIGSLLAGAGMDINARLGGSIQFFLYDVIKITVLLCFLIFDFCHFLYPELFSAGEKQENIGTFPRHWCKCGISAAGDGDAFLFVLIHTAVHWIYQRWAAPGRYVFLPDFLPDGGSGKPCTADEHIWSESRSFLCGNWLGYRSYWRNAD